MGIHVSVRETGMSNVTAVISGFEKKSADLTIPMKKAAIIMMSSVQKNFDRSGRPVLWKPLAKSTLKEKLRKGYSPKPLIRTGALRQSFASKYGKMDMKIGTSIFYGKFHQFGTSSIPARPYMIFQREDLSNIKDLVVKHLTSVN